MAYVQGFVIPVPAEKKDAYLAQATAFAPMLKEWGAERIVECWGEDVPEGKTTDFRRAVAAEAGESVVFSWVTWPDRATCHAAAAKMQNDPRMAEMGEMPFDGKRMIFGGFAPIFDSDG